MRGAVLAGNLGAAGRRRFIFPTLCNTAFDIPLARILRVSDLVRAWGGRPPPHG